MREEPQKNSRVKMDILFNNEVLSTWLIHYGSIALFVLLVVGIIILPIPEETLMVVAGVLMNQGLLPIPSTILAAYAGSICGITSSYTIGRTLGHFLITQYGSWIGITEKRLQQVHSWFERYGKWTLLIGYFIPGVRHLTGFTSGMAEMEFKQFSLFAYTGALLWSSLFLSLGYFCGGHCFAFFKILENVETDTVLAILLVVVVVYILYKFFSKRNNK